MRHRASLAAVWILPLLTGCASGDARYDKSLAESPCDLLSREAVVKILDIGEKIGPAQSKKSQLVVEYRYCLWSYKQRTGFFDSIKPGPVERRLTISVTVFSASSDGTEGAKRWLTKLTQESSRSVSGVGERAYWRQSRFQGHPVQVKDIVDFQRANAVVTVKLNGIDCCRKNRSDRDLEPTQRRQMVMKAAQAADAYLLALK